MEISGSSQAQEVTVRRLRSGEKELAVFEFEGRLRDLMISSLREGYLTTGNYMPDAKAVAPQSAMSLAVAGTAAGATVLSNSVSSTLFMATANPATLMNLGDGVGSAVMGASGIVGQAAFIPVATSLPVVAPILAIQTLNTAVMMQQFRQVDRKLDVVKNTLDKAIARIEATHAGELLSASRMVDEVYTQYTFEGAFSQDMLVRLALAERDINSLSFRFRQLVDSRNSTDIDDIGAIQQANYDAQSAMLASFMELRISYLRVCVDMQENPNSVNVSLERLKNVIDDGIVFWHQLQDRSRPLKTETDNLKVELAEMTWAERRVPGGKGSALEKKIEKHNAAYTAMMESEREIISDFHSLIESASDTRKALDEPEDGNTSATLVYWQDESGEHSFVTEQNIISA